MIVNGVVIVGQGEQADKLCIGLKLGEHVSVVKKGGRRIFRRHAEEL